MTVSLASVPTDLDEYRAGLRAWLEEHRDDLVRTPSSHDDLFLNGLALNRTMWDAGWKRVGWPQAVGGLGRGPRHRATYYDELCRSGIEVSDVDNAIEVMVPAILEFAPDLAADYVGRFLAGEEAWGQGFSEPDAGSDLAALRTRGVVASDEVLVDGQKVWTSHGHLSARILTLVRTGSTERRHRGLGALLIDTDSTGVTRRPLTFASGVHELSEVFFDGVRVPIARMIGAPGQGWAVAMYMLQYERSMYAAQRQAWLDLKLRQLAKRLDGVASDATTSAALGAAWLQVQALRARAIESVRRLDGGEAVGPDASADKILLARAEQSVFEVARHALRSGFAFDDDAASWRIGWWYSRATSILGGSGEIQRSTVADRVLRLPRENEER